MAVKNPHAGTRGQPRSFAKILVEHGHGTLNAHASELLQDVIVAIGRHAEESGSARGEFVLKLKIAGEKDGQITIKPDIATKMPKGHVSSERFYVTADQNLSSRDPRQVDIDDLIDKPNFTKEVQKV